MHISMAVFGDLRFDYRVFREAQCLCQAGHRVSIVSSAFDPAPLQGWGKVELHLIPIDRSGSLRLTYPHFWRQARKLLLAARADAYHAHDLDALWPAAAAARRFDVPLIYDSHEYWTEQSSLVTRPAIRHFWALLESRLIRRVHRTIAVSTSIARSLQEQYGLEEVVVVRNLPLYRSPVPSDRIRAELGLAADRRVVLYQGGFLTDNGLAEQIDAFGGLGEDLAFVLVGDGPRETALKAQVRERGLGDRVYFIPRVPFAELHSYTCSADLGLCLIKGTGRSFYYSLPNKLFEYLMAGLPVLASDFPDMRAVIEESAAGLVANPNDPEEIRAQIQGFFADPARAPAYRQAALAAARRYNWEQEAPRLLAVYAGL